MEVLALAAFPIEAAATRYRLFQLAPGLADMGIRLTVRPFLDSGTFASLYQRSNWPQTAAGLIRASAFRLADLGRVRRADVLLVQREALLFGPPVVEWLALRLGNCPLVLDLDDATYVGYVSPTYGRLSSWLKAPGKTDQLIRWASVVTCGNPVISKYVTDAGGRAQVVPTVVDTATFTPRPDAGSGRRELVVGWIGSHSTLPFLERLAPVLRELAAVHRFRLKVVGAGRAELPFGGVEVDNLPWSLDREVADFQSLDVGLYPLPENEWSVGKSGLKSIQYMAVGVPFVASPVGVVGEIGQPGVTHLCATSLAEWRDALDRLLSDADLRARMGRAGRSHVLGSHTVPDAVGKLAAALREAAS